MWIVNSFLFSIFVYLLSGVFFNQCYKLAIKNMRKAGAMTVLIEGLAGIFSVPFMFLFDWKVPTNASVYFFLILAIFFYALNDRLSTTARRGMEASLYIIIKQLSTVFMIIAGIFFFREPSSLGKIFGSILVLLGNFIAFYERGKWRWNRSILLGILANLSMNVALFLDVNFSNQFNLSFYVFMILLVPAVLIYLFDRVSIRDLREEYCHGDKKMIFLTAISWSIMMISKLRSYQLGDVVICATLCSLTVIFNVVAGYFFLHEKSNMIQKIIASLLIILGLFFVKL